MGDLLAEGVNLMLIGMGAVFFFLVLLIFTTTLMSSLVTRFLPEPEPESPLITNPQANRPAPVSDKPLLAVIAAAVHRHRTRHK